MSVTPSVVLEQATLRFQPIESLEYHSAHRGCETAVDLSNVSEGAPIVITNQDRVEVSAGWSVAADHEIAAFGERTFSLAGEVTIGLVPSSGAPPRISSG
jgi:hypothetical protein